MNTMTRDEMIEFLKGMDCRKKLLDEEKSRIRGSVETMQEAIYRNKLSIFANISLKVGVD